MITKEEARIITIEYLHLCNRDYDEVDKEDSIAFNPKEKIIYGEKKDEIIDTYAVPYFVQVLDDFDLDFVILDANTGDILYSMSSTRWIEAYE